MKEHLDEDIIDVFVNTGDQLSAMELIWKRFIETHETLPELWNKSHASCMNEYKRKVSGAQLLEIFKELKSETKEADVSKKLNTMRSNFRRELNRIKSSARRGFNLTVSQNDKCRVLHEWSKEWLWLIQSDWQSEWSCRGRLRFNIFTIK